MSKSGSNRFRTRGSRPHKRLNVFLTSLHLENCDGGDEVSVDSLETIDDNPGPGRTLDKYVYQKGGRLLEKVAKTVKLSFSTTSYPLPNSLRPNEADHAILHDVDTVEGTTSSFSTMDTISNNPGPGRVLDKYFYQKVGRWIERVTVRIALSWASLPSEVIVTRTLELGNFTANTKGPEFFNLSTSPRKASYIARRLTSIRHGCATIDGLKCLFRQTQSNSVPHRASALAGLLRLAAHDTIYLDFIYHYIPVEDAFNTKNLMKTANPSRQYLDPLLSFAEAVLSIFNRIDLSKELVNLLQIYLLDATEKWQYVLTMRFSSTSTTEIPPRRSAPIKAVADACCAFVQCTTCATRLWVAHALHPLIAEFFQIVYLYTVFLVKSLTTLYYQVSGTHRRRDQQYRDLLVLTFIPWFDSLALSVMKSMNIFSIDNWLTPEMAQIAAATNCIFLLHSEAELLFPRCFKEAQKRFFDRLKPRDALPRRFRNHCVEWERIRGNIHHLFCSVTSRHTMRFLKVDGELDAAVQEAYFRFFRKYSSPSMRHSRQGVHRGTEGRLFFALQRARESTRGHQAVMTEEYEQAIVRNSSNDRYWASSNWIRYKASCKARHAWGEYLRSNFDWDWNPSQSLKRVFREQALNVHRDNEPDFLNYFR